MAALTARGVEHGASAVGGGVEWRLDGRQIRILVGLDLAGPGEAEVNAHHVGAGSKAKLGCPSKVDRGAIPTLDVHGGAIVGGCVP